MESRQELHVQQPSLNCAGAQRRPIWGGWPEARWGHSERLPDELGNAWQAKPLAAATRGKIVEKLTLLCKRQQSQAKS